MEKSQQYPGILVLYSSNREYVKFKSKLMKLVPHSNVHFVCAYPKDFKLMPVIDQCKEIIESFGVTVIINRPEVGCSIYAAILEHFPDIQGPSLVATFLAQNKYYTRKVIGQALKINIPYAVVFDPTDAQAFTESLEHLPSNTKLISKPIFGAGSQTLRVIEKKEELYLSDVSLALNKLKASPKYLRYKELFSRYFSPGQFDIRPGFLIERYAEKDPTVATFHGVDCLIYNGRFIPWCIHDQIYWPQRQDSNVGSAFPTSLSATMVQKVWSVAEQIAEELIGHGFDHQFFEAELIVFADGDVALMEINGRMPFTMIANAYTDVLIDGDPIETLIKMANNQVVTAPRIRANVHGLSAQIVLYGKGIVSDLIDIPKAKQILAVELDLQENEFIDGTVDHNGYIIGSISCVGNSRHECLQQARDVMAEIVKVQNAFSWTLYADDIDKLGA